MVAKSCVKIKTRKGNRNEIYLVKSDNRKYDIFCGHMYTVEKGHFNEFIMIVTVKSEVN